jgi:hypothetical protein
VAKRLTPAVYAVAEEPLAVNGNRSRRTVRRYHAEPQAAAPSPVDMQLWMRGLALIPRNSPPVLARPLHISTVEDAACRG